MALIRWTDADSAWLARHRISGSSMSDDLLAVHRDGVTADSAMQHPNMSGWRLEALIRGNATFAVVKRGRHVARFVNDACPREFTFTNDAEVDRAVAALVRGAHFLACA